MGGPLILRVPLVGPLIWRIPLIGSLIRRVPLVLVAAVSDAAAGGVAVEDAGIGWMRLRRMLLLVAVGGGGSGDGFNGGGVSSG